MDADPSNEDRREVINGFVLGCTERISERLNELCAQSASVATSNARALVVVKNQAVQAKLDELRITLRARYSSCAAWDDSS